jgi:hypothetical protein
MFEFQELLDVGIISINGMYLHQFLEIGRPAVAHSQILFAPGVSNQLSKVSNLQFICARAENLTDLLVLALAAQFSHFKHKKRRHSFDQEHRLFTLAQKA